MQNIRSENVALKRTLIQPDGADAARTEATKTETGRQRRWRWCTAGCVAGCIAATIILATVGEDGGQLVGRNTDVGAYDRVHNDVLLAPDTMIFVAYGQSNADCCGEAGYTVKHPSNVLQFFEGNVYRMREPMLGAYCRGGCIWSRVGDMLVDVERRRPTGRNISVVFVAAAVPGFAIADLVPRTTNAGRYFESVGIQLPTATVLFQQGEADALRRTPSAAYRAMLAAIGAAAPGGRFQVGVGTRCGDVLPYPPIAEVQRQYGNGPDLDALGDAFRRPDRCHFTTRGLTEAAARWTAAVAPPYPTTPDSTM